MSRPLRLELPDGLYHVTSRGDRCERIFEDDADRDRLLQVLDHALSRFDAVAFAYCLMGNHYHFVLKTRRANLSRLMRHVNGVYSQSYNRRHGLVGHLFQGRFKAIHVDVDAYFLEVCRYVELNPVRAGIVDDPSRWPWSSHRAHIGSNARPAWLDSEALYAQLLGSAVRCPEDAQRARSIYARFVREGREERLWARGLRQEIYLGDEPFVSRVQAFMNEIESANREIPQIQRLKPGTASAGMSGSRSRETRMLEAYASGQTLSLIAADWKLSISRVSRLIKKAEGRHPHGVERRRELLDLPGKT